MQNAIHSTNRKRDIQAWWGDLYQQVYAGHEDGIAPQEMLALLREMEDLFHKRQMLAVVEMPLADLSGKKVLEIGSGSGAHSALFKSRGASVTAVDITRERAAATARKLALVPGGEGRALQGDAEELPFGDGVFDIVYSNGVLHHSVDTERCLAEVQRVLKPGGRAILMLYARHSAIFWCQVLPRALLTGEIFRWPEAEWIGRLTEGKPKFGSTKNPFTRVFSARELERLIRGFRLVSLRKSSFQFDNFLFPRLTQIRTALLKFFGGTPHAGGVLVYGQPMVPETRLEIWLGRRIGFAWNIVLERQ